MSYYDGHGGYDSPTGLGNSPRAKTQTTGFTLLPTDPRYRQPAQAQAQAPQAQPQKNYQAPLANYGQQSYYGDQPANSGPRYNAQGSRPGQAGAHYGQSHPGDATAGYYQPFDARHQAEEAQTAQLRQEYADNQASQEDAGSGGLLGQLLGRLGIGSLGGGGGQILASPGGAAPAATGDPGTLYANPGSSNPPAQQSQGNAQTGTIMGDRPRVNSAPIFNGQDMSRAVNSAQATNARNEWSANQSAQGRMAQGGWSAASPALAALQNRNAMGRSAADVQAQTQLPMQMRQANAEFTQKGQALDSETWGTALRALTDQRGQQTQLTSSLLSQIFGLL